MSTFVSIEMYNNHHSFTVMSLKGKLRKVDLLIKLDCFIKKLNKIFNYKRSQYKLVSTRRSTVLNLPLQQDFPGFIHQLGNEVIMH